MILRLLPVIRICSQSYNIYWQGAMLAPIRLTNAGSCPFDQRGCAATAAQSGRTKGTAQLPCGSGETQGEASPLHSTPPPPLRGLSRLHDNAAGPSAGAWSMRILLCLGMALMLAFFVSPGRAAAHTMNIRNTSTGQPTLQMVVGFDDNSRLDYWTPAWITLSNDGPDFRGVLTATTYANARVVAASSLPWSYKQPVVLPHGAQKQISIYVPFYESPSVPLGVVATLSDNNGKMIATQTVVPFTLDRGSPLLIGILSDQTAQGAVITPLSAVSLPDPTRPIEVAALDASTLPDMAEALGNFDVIVLDDFSTSTLNPAQLAALQTWVNQGGALIEAGGPQWQQTLAALPPQLLPVVINGTGALPAGTNLLPAGGPTIAEIGQRAAPGTLRKSITISTATMPGKDDARQQALSNLETVLASGTTPLIVQAHQGQGIICYLAFDPASEPFVNWPGTIALWKGLLLRTLGDQALIPNTPFRYSNGPGQTILRGGLWQIMQPSTLFPIWELLFLLLGYIILIGPVRLLIVKRLKLPTWSWRIVLSGVVVFSLLTYGLANYQKGASINSISIIQLNQGGQFAHVTTFFSVFTPGQGDFQVHIPARTLAQPVTDRPFQGDSRVVSNSDYHPAFTVGQNETDVELPDVGSWSLRGIVSEGDQKLGGGLLSGLALHNGSLVGTVTDTLDTALTDVYILMPHSFAYIGKLPAGQAQQVNVPLHSSTLNSASTLADQIARDNQLPVPYFPYTHGSQPQNDFQRHLAILSALSGEGFSYTNCSGPCSTSAIISEHLITTPPTSGPKGIPLDGSDSLLVAGAPATLIGWADQPVDATNGVTINGASAGGTHDEFIQVPLDIDFSGAIPAGFIPGQVIDAQGNEVQIISPDVYSMKTGSITFEFTLPDNLQINTMTITEPFLGQPVLDSNHVQVRLYNWGTGSWDTIALNSFTFTTENIRTYTNLDRHVLLQVVNQNASLGAILFVKPSLGLGSAKN
jgi:hypothetical protein